MRAERPADHVDVVDVLLDDVVAAGPAPGVPVIDLPLDIGHALLAFAVMGDGSAAPVALAAREVADGAVVDAFEVLLPAGAVAALRAGHDGEFLLVRFVGGLADLVVAPGVDADGLLHEDVLALGDGLAEVVRAEAGRGGGHDVIHAGGDDLLVVVEPAEAVVLVGGDGVGHLVLFAPVRDPLPGALGAVFPQVAEGHDLHLLAYDLGGFEVVADRPVGAAAAADEAHLEDVAAGGVGHAGAQAGCHRRGAGGGTAFQEGPTRNTLVGGTAFGVCHDQFLSQSTGSCFRRRPGDGRRIRHARPGGGGTQRNPCRVRPGLGGQKLSQ